MIENYTKSVNFDKKNIFWTSILLCSCNFTNNVYVAKQRIQLSYSTIRKILKAVTTPVGSEDFISR
jgi:hypothetical protein